VVAEGQPAPDFELAAHDGERVRLSDLRGRTVVLYFYSRNDTPGCTKEACGFRDAYGEFEARGAVVLGVSRDDEASHGRFRAKYELPFTLLADPEHDVAESYGVWGERKLYGKTSMGMTRSTFVIDPDGTIVRAMRGVKPDGHPEQVLAALPG
jgi:thioredoxin-dependent peroxiredoxin